MATIKELVAQLHDAIKAQVENGNFEHEVSTIDASACAKVDGVDFNVFSFGYITIRPECLYSEQGFSDIYDLLKEKTKNDRIEQLKAEIEKKQQELNELTKED